MKTKAEQTMTLEQNTKASATLRSPSAADAALEQLVQQTVASFDTIEVGLGGDAALTATQKRHLQRFRKGGESVIAQIGHLVQQQQLESPSLNATDMLALLAKARALQPLSNRAAAFRRHVDDVIFSTQGEALSMGQQLYALLRRRSLDDVELATALSPVVTFFARKSKPKAAGTLTKSQARATSRAIKTITKHAPHLLQGGATAATPARAASPAGTTPTAGAAPPMGSVGRGATGDGGAPVVGRALSDTAWRRP